MKDLFEPGTSLSVGRFVAAGMAVMVALACTTPRRTPKARISRAAAPPPAAVHARAEAWSAAFQMRNGVADLDPLPDVVVHAPPGFDARAPLHLVVLMHGLGHSALVWAGGGLPDPLTGRPVVGWAGDVRHDLAGTRSLLVAPQFEVRPGHAHMGRFAARGAFRRFLGELLGETLAARLGGPRTLADVESLTLVGSSAGGPTIANLLDLDDLDGRVRNVVLFDSLYGAESIFARWLRGGDEVRPRRLVCIHAGSRYTRAPADRLAAMLRPWLRDRLSVQPREAMTEAIRMHRAVFATVNCEHICMGPAYLDKVLRGLDLPRRDPDEDLKTPVTSAPLPAAVVAFDRPVRGALTSDDPPMRDGSVFDDYAVDLDAGAVATITVRGGGTRGYLCRSLDVQVRVMDGERVLADDDDGAGGLASRVTFRAPRSGQYTVRVMSHGPWRNFGDYTLIVQRAPDPGAQALGGDSRQHGATSWSSVGQGITLRTSADRTTRTTSRTRSPEALSAVGPNAPRRSSSASTVSSVTSPSAHAAASRVALSARRDLARV